MPFLKNTGLAVVFFLALFCSKKTAAQSSLLDRRVSFSCDVCTATDALTGLSRASGVNVVFSPDFFRGERPNQAFVFQQKKLGACLSEILIGKNLDFELIDNQVVIFKKTEKEAPQKWTVSGIIEDADSGERLVGASVFDPVSRRGSAANEYGFFSLALDAGERVLQFSYLGFAPERREIFLEKNVALTVRLRPDGKLPEIIVRPKTAEKDSLEAAFLPSAMSPDLPLAASKNLPNLGGEADLSRLAMLLPGAAAGADGLGGLHVRGGESEHTLVLFDDAPVYYGTHALGHFSIFNGDAVRSARLFKGEIPARFGGRLGSVLDVRTKEGNLQKTEIAASAGLLAGSFSIQQPLKKDRAAVLFTARESLFGPFLRHFSEKSKNEKRRTGSTDYRFFDVNAKAHFKIGKKNEPARGQFLVSFYAGQDSLRDLETTGALRGGLPDTSHRKLGYGWQNRFVSARWNHRWSERFFSNAVAAVSRFEYRNNSVFDEVLTFGPDSAQALFYQKLHYRTVVEDVSARWEGQFWPQNPAHRLRFGASAAWRKFVPGQGDRLDIFLLPEPDTLLILLRLDTLRAEATSVFFEDDWTISPRFSANLGLRATGFSTRDAFFKRLEPRFSLRFLSKKGGFSGKAAFAKTNQFVHVLKGLEVGTPADLWIPALAKAPPQAAWQAELGFEKRFGPTFSASAVGFFGRKKNLAEWASGRSRGDLDAPILQIDSLDRRVTRGEGWDRGLEILLALHGSAFSGWISYTLSRSDRRFERLNGGQKFPFRYDRRHQLHATAAWQLSETVTASLAATFLTGDAITNDLSQPLGDLSFLDLNILLNDRSEVRNNVRLPDYARLDGGFVFQLPSRWKKFSHTLAAGVFNATNRQNVRFSYLVNSATGQRRSLRALSALPYLTYSMKI